MKKNKNIWIIYSPFLIGYILFVCYFHKEEMLGDEWRYMMYANNLLKGYYSPKEFLSLWNGPGYPLLLVPFVLLKLPLICITLLNAIFRYCSVVLLHKTIEQYTNRKTAFLFCLFWAFYYLDFYKMAEIHTETFTSFLIVLFLFLLQKSFSPQKKYNFDILLGVVIGYIVLTKIIFGYVLLCLFFLWALIFLFNYFFSKFDKSYVKKIGKILAISLLTILPYLIYTYSLTNRIYYLGDSGGMSLYWMSTPFEEEYGDWNGAIEGDCLDAPSYRVKRFCQNHSENFKYILQFTGVARDDAYKQMALENIKKYPIKYLRNCIANQGRMWFNFPFSYHYQRDQTLLRIIPNTFLLALLIISFPLWILNFRKCDIEISWMFLFFLIYFFGTTLVSAYPRQLNVVVPIILCWSAYLFFRTLTINLKFRNSELLSDKK